MKSSYFFHEIAFVNNFELINVKLDFFGAYHFQVKPFVTGLPRFGLRWQEILSSVKIIPVSALCWISPTEKVSGIQKFSCFERLNFSTQIYSREVFSE